MILKFDEFLSEGVQSVVPLSDVKKIMEPFDWTYTRGTGDSCKFSKGKYTVYFHLKHNASNDDRRFLDVGGLDKLREYIVDEFLKTGDPSNINSIPWEVWRLPDPFKRELKDYDSKTGKKKEIKQEPNIGQKLNKAKVEREINDANELYKDDQLLKVSDTCYIITHVNEKGVLMYNICRGKNDRRPILKNWYDGRTNYKKVGKDHYFGKDNLRDISTRFYKVLDDGTLDKVENIDLRESKNIEKNLELL